MARLLIKFTKTNGAKFISHLDTMRTIHRAIRRAELPISYSKGFNPHAAISVAAPLSLGISSVAEYADVDLDIELEAELVLKALNEALPMDIKIVKVITVLGKMPASMAAVAFAEYSLYFDKRVDNQTLDHIIKEILNSEEIMKMKRSKAGEKLVNIRQFIVDLDYKMHESGLAKFTFILKAGSNGSLGADAMAGLIKEYSNGELCGHPFITREEIYTNINDNRISLDRYFSGK